MTVTRRDHSFCCAFSFQIAFLSNGGITDCAPLQGLEKMMEDGLKQHIPYLPMSPNSRPGHAKKTKKNDTRKVNVARALDSNAITVTVNANIPHDYDRHSTPIFSSAVTTECQSFDAAPDLVLRINVMCSKNRLQGKNKHRLSVVKAYSAHISTVTDRKECILAEWRLRYVNRGLWF